jgi:hypothetical protein
MTRIVSGLSGFLFKGDLFAKRFGRLYVYVPSYITGMSMGDAESEHYVTISIA